MFSSGGIEMKERFAACMLGGAIGDALGYTVEFMHYHQIQSWFGPTGILEPQTDSKTGMALISDDTQMALFTLDGMIWAYESGLPYVAGGLYPSYLRWLYTQTGNISDPALLERQIHEGEDTILAQKELHFRRAPGSTCLSALRSGKMGAMKDPVNDSKGCGGVMRVAPIGLFLYNDPAHAFRVGAESAAITHGHPTGYLAAGTLAAIIALLVAYKELGAACDEASLILRRYAGYEETLRAIDCARTLAAGSLQTEHAIRKLGEGWVAEEALSIGIYCALKKHGFKRSLVASVNHDGDSDSTGAICGYILGASGGMRVIPKDWADRLELHAYIVRRSEELSDVRKSAPRKAQATK